MFSLEAFNCKYDPDFVPLSPAVCVCVFTLMLQEYNYCSPFPDMKISPISIIFFLLCCYSSFLPHTRLLFPPLISLFYSASFRKALSAFLCLFHSSSISPVSLRLIHSRAGSSSHILSFQFPIQTGFIACAVYAAILAK